MRSPALLAAALVLCAAGAAWSKPIGAAEAKRTFFGLDMSGIYQPDGEPWRECVTSQGDTIYWFGGQIDYGRLSVRDDGVLCFSYQSSDFKHQGCYTAEPDGKGWRFADVSDPTSVFLAQHTTRAKTCDANAPSV
jgi:hypothetical protein